ncbi:Protein of unknown function DUF115 [Marinobacter gudaonensis]|uniref:DUF115 domain-containing protein n=1 Tax=Marinobacter gudaonensis TaxID=375760 RepID=A0A1I6GIT1_9GAMM|nr:6-hydroxymethylpterin diphosphokinase MptE-like protein [Marinobacter gudaonensis]SFR42102.1 Protein of unknown function DUF115 [Marinobacter gudaonensis]
MSENEDIAVPFIRRKQKNLAYFQKYRPEIFQYFSDYQPTHCELVITPGRDDVDLVDSGRSVYRHLACEYSRNEVSRFLDDYPPERPLQSMEPPFLKPSEDARFASRYVRESASESSLTPESFRGYFRGKSFPCVIFLGCGLGYHIEALVEKAELIDAVVFEPDPDRFALTLFTVDWEEICKKFRQKGRSISFCLSTDPSEDNIRRVLSSKVAEMVPLYPYLCTYFNHLANVDLYRIAREVERDLPVVGANWGSYDFELRGFRNVYHNLNLRGAYLKPYLGSESHLPVAIVGSGPSLDDRIESLKKNRDKVVIFSAGTGLRALLSHGVRPDFHVELDADYMIYEMLTDIRESYGLDGIELLCTVSVNPLVPPLFERSSFYFSNEYYIPALLGLHADAIPGCTPTCTNAALAIAFSIGFRNLYLFGTDYGYVDKQRHHSMYSVYGEKSASEFATRFRSETEAQTEARPKFEVEGVNNRTVITQSDYYTAKRSVENYLQDRLKQGLTFSVRNCSDGAVIEGAEWMSAESFTQQFSGASDADRHAAVGSVQASIVEMPDLDARVLVRSVVDEITMTSNGCLDILKGSRLAGRKDLVVVCNQIRDFVNRVGQGSGRQSHIVVQLMGWQMIKGTVQRFLQVGLCHGLAHEDENLAPFLKHWSDTLKEFLRLLPGHFRAVMESGEAPQNDDWVTTRLMNPEPDWAIPENI